MSKKFKNIIIIGPMGVGKTTIGVSLAKELKLNFFDSDMEIINNTGVSIDHIFDIEGEDGFRIRETKILEEISKKSGAVIATGGGIVMSATNRKILKKTGLIIYLKSSIKELAKRTSNCKNRPIINKSDNIETTIKDIIKKREPLYKEIANLEIDTTKYSYKNLIKKIVNYVQN